MVFQYDPRSKLWIDGIHFELCSLEKTRQYLEQNLGLKLGPFEFFTVQSTRRPKTRAAFKIVLRCTG